MIWRRRRPRSILSKRSKAAPVGALFQFQFAALFEKRSDPGLRDDTGGACAALGQWRTGPCHLFPKVYLIANLFWDFWRSWKTNRLAPTPRPQAACAAANNHVHDQYA
jgi:hypothetical protein